MLPSDVGWLQRLLGRLGSLFSIKAIRFDVRWLRRHPFRWLRVAWMPWFFAVMLALKAFVITLPVYELTAGSKLWPILLGVTAGCLAASAVVPLSIRLQLFTASLLFGVAALRVATYANLLLVEGIAGDAYGVVVGFMIHWTIIGGFAVWWPAMIEDVGRRMTVESGRDDRGMG